MKTINVGILGTMQHNFTGDKSGNYKRAVDKMTEQSKKLGFSLYVYDQLIVDNADVERFKKASAEEKLDILFIAFACFASGEIMTSLLDAAPHIGLWALTEPNSDGVLGYNSFCGMNMYTSNLMHYYRKAAPPHKWFFGLEKRFERRLEITVSALQTIKNMQGARVGIVGDVVPGFNDLYYDERTIRENLGIEIVRNIEVADIIEASESYSESDIEEELKIVSASYCRINSDISVQMEKNARFFKAITDMATIKNLEAIAVACWPKIQNQYNMLACSTLGKLNEQGLPTACEGDLVGAVSMLMLKYAAQRNTMLMDLVAFDEKDDSVQMWHCGPASPEFANDDGCCLDCFYENMGGTVSRRNGVHDMTFRAGEATIMRMTEDCTKMFVSTGVFDSEKTTYFGSGGWLNQLTLADEPINAVDFIETIMSAGIPHHYPIVYGDMSDVMLEIASWLNLKTQQKIAYKDYRI